MILDKIKEGFLKMCVVLVVTGGTEGGERVGVKSAQKVSRII